MTGGFVADPEALQRAARELQSAADELYAAVDSFAQRLGTVGDPWGLDTLGMLIGGGYVAIEKLALTTFDSVVESLDDFAEGVAMMAGNYTQTEDDTLDQFGSFDGDV